MVVCLRVKGYILTFSSYILTLVYYFCSLKTLKKYMHQKREEINIPNMLATAGFESCS